MEFILDLTYCLLVIGKYFIYYLIAAFTYHQLKKLICKKPGKLKDKTMMVLFGSGGHTTEMLHMLDGLKVERYGRVIFIIGHSDTWSMKKVLATVSDEQLKQVTFLRLFRAREVK